MKKILFALLIMVLVISACATKPTEAPAEVPVAPAGAEEAAPAETIAPESALKEKYELAFVIPGTDSQYWNQYCGTGLNNAVLDIEEKYGVDINVTLSGPTAEGETDKYLNILESVIATKPDVIITATMQPDGTSPLIKQAADQGIYVNLFSLGITGNEDSYGALYYCNQPEQGKLAAEEMVRQMDKMGIEKKGVVGMHLATLVPILVEKMEMFRSTMKELAPEIEVLDTLYNENDAAKAQANVENQISTYGDQLIGIFAGNNLSGDGTVLAIRKAGLQGKIVAIAVDSDELEIEGLKDGSLTGIVLQTPYAQAYQATYDAFEHLFKGYNPPNEVNLPASIVTLENMEDPEMQALLNPLILKR
jgi:ribose transport system substrate-binding protein